MARSKNRRLRSLVLLAALALALLATVSQAALAQDWSFALNEKILDVWINPDGTVRFVYDLTFTPDPGAHAIDAVDIGMPNDTYTSMQASIDGVPLTDIGSSPYVKPGVAVELGSHAIRPGQTGTLHFEATIRNLLYRDSKDAEYASIEFTPTWFDADIVHGSTRQEVNLHFPPGVTSEEARYHDQEFTEALVEDDRVVYTWIDENAGASRRYVYGASFPKRAVAENVIQTAPAVNLDLGKFCASPVWWIGAFVVGWGAIAALGSVGQKRRKMQYLPPSLGVEGTGIKRGLTAVEAAVLLEAPLNKVLTMILFSLIKKGQIIVESEKPLRVQRTDAPAEAAKLRDYEERFLLAIKKDGGLSEGELREMIVGLIGDVNNKLNGFSRKETVAYYKDIAARAWQQVESSDTPEVLGANWGEGLEWTMLDKDWDDHTRRVFHDRPVVLPNWWGGYRPWVASPSSGRPSVSVPTGGGQPISLPTLPGADFANTVVSGIENASNTVVRSVENFAGGVTTKTNPPPKTSGSTRSGGGGHSCACACACAGCACACAGGGR